MKLAQPLIKSFMMLLLVCSQTVMANNTLSDEDVYSYLQLSGADKAISAIPAQIQGMGQQMQLTSENPEEHRKTTEKVLAAWNEDAINKAVFDYVKNNFTADEMSQLLTWLKSDLASRIKRAEEQAAEPNFEQAFLNYLADVKANPPSEARIALVREYIETTNVVENTVDMVAGLSQTMIKNLSPTKIEQGAIDAQMNQMRTMLTAQMEQQMIMVSYFLYENISDHDLSKYIDFYQQDLGQKEIKVMYGSIGSAMNLWAENMGKSLAKN